MNFKQRYFSILLILICHLATGQTYTDMKSVVSKVELEAIEEAVDKYWKWENDDHPKQAVEDLEKLIKKYPDNWLASYWASYISTQIANSIQGEEEYLKKAQTFYEQAESRFDQKGDSLLYSCFPALQALIYRLESFKADGDVKDKLYQQSFEALNEAYRISLENPILWVLTATDPSLNLAINIGNRAASGSLLQNAKKAFEKIPRKSSADPYYWNEHWVKFWLGRLQPDRFGLLDL